MKEMKGKEKRKEVKKFRRAKIKFLLKECKAI